MNNPARFFVVFGLAIGCSFSAQAKDPKLEINFLGSGVPFAEPELLLVRGRTHHPVSVIVNLRPIVVHIRDFQLRINGRPVTTSFNPTTRVATCRIQDGDFNWDAKKSNTLIAEATAGSSSFVSNELTIVGLPFPKWLGRIASFGGNQTNTIFTYRLGLDVAELTRTIPVLGEFGLGFALNGELELDTEQFEFGAEISGGAEITHGGSSTTINIGGGGAGGVVQESPEEAFRFIAEQWTVFLELSKEFELMKKTVADVIKPGATRTLSQIPIIGTKINRVLSKFSITITAAPSLRGSLVIEPENRPQIVSGLVSGELDVRATANARLRTPGFGKVGLTGFVGGKPTFEIQTMRPVFRQLGFQAFAGVGFYFGPWNTEFNHTFINVRTGPVRQHPPVESVLSDNDGNNWEVLTNPGRTRYPIVAANQTPAQQAAMRRFVALGNRLSTARPEPANFRRSSAVVTLATNSSPLSHPAMAARGDELMVVLAEDSRPEGEQTSPCQFTRLVSTFFDGVNWSTPRRLTPPGHRADGAQIDPSVCYDGSGRAIAVWQQMSDSRFNTDDPGRYLQRNDVYASILDPRLRVWGFPFDFGTPGRADLAPYARGPLTYGDVIVVWQRSRVASFYATRAPAPETEFRMVLWNNQTSRWVQERAVMPVSENVVGFDFDARNNVGVLVLNLDRGGKGLNADYELQFNQFNATTRQWSGVRSLTNDNAYDVNPSVLVSSAEEIFVVWTRNGSLVVDRNLQNRPEVIRRNSDGTEITEVRIQDLTHGRVSLTWTENSLRGATVITKIYDPRTKTWGTNSLCPGLPMETVYDVVSDRAGNLVTLFTETAVDLQTVRGPDENNRPIVIEEVPILGKQSIQIAKYRPTSHVVLNRLTLNGQSLNLSNPIRPGSTIEFIANLQDRGLLGEKNVEVTFFEGDPRAGGRRLGVRSANLRGGGSSSVRFLYRVPDPIPPRPIYAQLDSGQSKLLHLRGRLVTATELDSVVRPDGSGYVDALIANDGAPSTGSFQVVLRDSSTQRQIASTNVPGISVGASQRIRLTFESNGVRQTGANFEIHIDRSGIRGPIIRTENDTVFLERPTN